MSPEHFFDFKNADQQSDIYSLGKILYEAIDGKIISKILPFKSAALENPETPFLKELDKIIQTPLLILSTPVKQPSGKKADSSQMDTHMMDMHAAFNADKSQSKTPVPRELGENFKE